MKSLLVFLFFFQLSFGQVNLEHVKITHKDSVYEDIQFPIGDVDNNAINDYATVSFFKDKDVAAYMVNIKFSNNDFEMGFYPCESIYITTTEDVNKDRNNEIIIFSKNHEGWWNDIYVWTFKNKEWTQIAETKGFCADNEDFENRVMKIKGNYYLIGETTELDQHGDFEKVKVKL